MADISARALNEDNWQVYRDLRLSGLQESPEAFVDSYDTESKYDEQFWRERLRGGRRFAAARNGQTVGLVGLGLHNDDPEVGEIFGLWVAPEARVTHVAWYLGLARELALFGRDLSVVFCYGRDYGVGGVRGLSLIHISEPTRRTPISYAVFCLKKKKK